MKLIVSGVANCAAITRSPSFSRSAIVDDDDHPALADLLDRVLDRGERGRDRHPRRLLPPISSRSTYFASTSTSRFTRWPGSSSPSVVAASVCGISATAKPGVVERRDGEARPLDGDRALLDGVAEDLRRRVDPDAATVALVLDAADDADAVDVPLDVVAAERLARTERRLDVDARARGEAAERGARERLGHRVEGDPAAVERDRGQAAAVDRDRVADRGRRRRLRRLDLEPDPVACRDRRSPPTSLTIPVNTARLAAPQPLRSTTPRSNRSHPTHPGLSHRNASGSGDPVTATCRVPPRRTTCSPADDECTLPSRSAPRYSP